MKTQSMKHLLLASFFLMLVSALAGEPTNSDKRPLTIASFSALPDQLTFPDLVLRVGPPDEDVGSGVYLYVYHLADGSDVIVGSNDGKTIRGITHRVKHKSTQLWPRLK